MKTVPQSHATSKNALAIEQNRLQQAVDWLQQHMPESFAATIDSDDLILIARNLLNFSFQDYCSPIHLPDRSFVLCLDDPSIDLKILPLFDQYAVRYYQTWTSDSPTPFAQNGKKLRIAYVITKEKEITNGKETSELGKKLPHRFCQSEPLEIFERLYTQAKISDDCQFEVISKPNQTGIRLLIAWKQMPKYRLFYRLAKILFEHQFSLQKASAAYVDPWSSGEILLLSIEGIPSTPSLDDFLTDLSLLHFLDREDIVQQTFPRLQSMHFIRSMICFVHQVLVYADPNLYSFENVTDGFCRYPELTLQLYEAFEAKFHPRKTDLSKYQECKKNLSQMIDHLSTGLLEIDQRRKTILKQAQNLIDHGLKTNFYCMRKSSFAFRLDPAYLESAPFHQKEKTLPFAVFFFFGNHFIGFHIRFKDLARGGVRTVIPGHMDKYTTERNSIFSEAYNLALTQQKKNKDIPEGGAKMVILLEPSGHHEEEILQREQPFDSSTEEKIKEFRTHSQIDTLYSAQQSLIASFMTLINCDPSGKLKSNEIVDYFQKPEYIYLGPDENMQNTMIEWIANYSQQCRYRPGRSFMSSKPSDGINHKEFGVTSSGVNVYMQETLTHLNINPAKDAFTVKISGGPDGDVAGNQILNLSREYPKTAKLVAIIDVSGVAYDPQGLNLEEMARLFHQGQPIRFFSLDKLSNGSFLLDLETVQEQSSYAKLTLCTEKKEGKLIKKWTSPNETILLYNNTIPETPCDIFIPAGGRPGTVNESNVHQYFDENGQPKIQAIVEGANLYLTPGARIALEKKGVLILKDSSCNKGGVICSSFEVLAGLCLSQEEFFKEKNEYVKEVLSIIKQMALDEAQLLLSTHDQTHEFLTDISEKISERINLYKYQLLEHLEKRDLSREDPFFMQCLFNYCPPLLQKKYRQRILDLPDIHQKAIIAAYIAARLVYARGLEWPANIVDSLPQLIQNPQLLGD